MAKQILNFSPTFTPASRTLNFSGYAGFELKNLLAVVNATRNTTIYAVGQPGIGYTAFSSGVLTLEFDTTSHAAGDVLSIFYDTYATRLPLQGDEYMPVRPLPQIKYRTTFARTIASGVDSEFFNLIVTGAGQTVSQANGNLLLTSGTTANSETILRSNRSFVDSYVFKWSAILSQRIANNNFFVELVDVIGDGLALTVNSATSITVTIPNNPFTSQNVGQSVYVGNIVGVAAAVPGRYAIASVSGNNVNFTVAGWPASGSGTVSLFGWNYHQVVYTGTTATSANYDAQRRGWNSGVTAATINTTASPGHMGIITNEDGVATFLDQLVASSAALQTTVRASRVQNLPAQEIELFIQIRIANGTAAPASSTTFTVGLVSLENYATQNVSINNIKPQPFNAAMPTAVVNQPTIGIAAGQTLATVSTVSTVTAVTTVGAITSANIGAPGVVQDVASAALTTSTTTAAFTPTSGASYSILIPVTVVAGTGPTLDVSIEESDDSGTNWVKVYDFPRITAIGAYRSPTIRARGNRFRYVQTVAGAGASFTRSIQRLQKSDPGQVINQLIDRTIVPNTLNSTSSSIYVEGCQDFNLVALLTAQTTAATIAVQFSDDNTNWHTSGTTISTVNGVNHAKVQNEQWRFARAIVTAAGTGITLNYLKIVGVGQ
jgi:hypothetical protein